MKRRIGILLMLLILIVPCFSETAKADMGPKPSIVVTFKGIENGPYYVTLLSETERSGPWSTSELDGWKHDEGIGSKIWKEFKDYQDSDGYYFLQYVEECSEENQFSWTYHPPDKFKILVYFPESDTMICNDEIYERYAFHSYYTATIAEEKLTVEEQSGFGLTVEESYDYSWEMISLACRIFATILIELIIAWFFGYRTMKQIEVIAAVNLVTQIGLNVALNVINYKNGPRSFVTNYILMEAAVVVIEGCLYQKVLGGYQEDTKKKLHPWGYAASANLCSFLLGLLIAVFLPGVF